MHQTFRRALAGLLAGIGAVSVAAVAWLKFQPAATEQGAWDGLNAERAALAYATDAKVAIARSAAAVRSWSDTERTAFLRTFTDEWAAHEESGRVVLSARALQIENWPGYLARIRMLEQEPALALESLEITAVGTRAQRRFTAVTITIRFIGTTARAETGPAPASARPPRVGDDQAAPPRQLGRVTALRRAADLRRASGRSARSPLRSVPTLRGPGPEHIQTTP